MNSAIVGYGVEGQALAEYFLAHGKHTITLCDARTPAQPSVPVGGDIKTKFGPQYLKELDAYDVIFRSPGVPYLKKEFNTVRSKLTSLTRYFFEKCPAKIIGVTGTKGKGTTSTLIYEMLKAHLAAGKAGRAFLGGNIGVPPLTFLDQLSKNDVVILELSSFQLQDLHMSPQIAVVLGITSDHLDHHTDNKEYIEAKKNIVAHQKKSDVAIFDFDNEVSASFAQATPAVKKYFSLQKPVKEGGFLKVGSLVLAQGKTGTIFGEKGDVALLGEHNLKNILAAAVAAQQVGVPVEVITKVAREFRGLPHRLEFVRESAGVRFYNDSASTNPDTTIAALHSFTTPLILIVGGSDKNADFTQLGQEIAKHLNIKTVILMGQTKSKIEAVIEAAVNRHNAMAMRRRDVPLELISAENYQEAFMAARLIAQPGDTVLLSPACASFDMFNNYTERGDTFKNFILDF